MGIVLTEAMMHVITESISDYYDASGEYKASYADRMAGAISAVLYIAQAESVPCHIPETKQGADQDVDPEAEQPQGGGGTEAPQHKEGDAGYGQGESPEGCRMEHSEDRGRDEGIRVNGGKAA